MSQAIPAWVFMSNLTNQMTMNAKAEANSQQHKNIVNSSPSVKVMIKASNLESIQTISNCTLYCKCFEGMWDLQEFTGIEKVITEGFPDAPSWPKDQSLEKHDFSTVMTGDISLI